MVTELNHDANKRRIVEIIKNDNTIYSGTRKGDSGKLGHVIVGIPDGADESADFANYAFVTNGTPLETITPKGTRGSDGSYITLEHTVRYDIVFIVDKKDAREAEKALDNLQQKINEALEENTQLGQPANITRDMLADTSYPERCEIYKPELYRGKSKQGRKITFVCIISTG